MCGFCSRQATRPGLLSVTARARRPGRSGLSGAHAARLPSRRAAATADRRPRDRGAPASRARRDVRARCAAHSVRDARATRRTGGPVAARAERTTRSARAAGPCWRVPVGGGGSTIRTNFGRSRPRAYGDDAVASFHRQIGPHAELHMPMTLRRVVAAGCTLAACARGDPRARHRRRPGAGLRAHGPAAVLRRARGGRRPCERAECRAAAHAVSGRSRRARERLVRGLGRQAVLDADPVTGTPRVARAPRRRADRGPQAGDPAAIALRLRPRATPAALGLASADLATLELADRGTTGGVTHLRWRQEYGGIPAFDNELRVNVDADGRVVNVLGAPRHALVRRRRPRRGSSAADALAALARNVGATDSATVTAGPSGARDDTRFSTGDRARLVLFGDVRAVRLAWHLTLAAAPDAWYDAVVDADTGAHPAARESRQGDQRERVPELPGAPPPGGTQVTRSLDPYLTTGTTTLSGPFAHAWSDINDRSASGRLKRPTRRRSSPALAVPDSRPFGGVARATTRPRCSWDHRVAPQLAGQPPAERRAGLLVRQSLPRPPRGSADRLHAHRRQLRGRRTPSRSRPTTGRTSSTGLPDDATSTTRTWLRRPTASRRVMQMYLFDERARTRRSARSTAATTPRSSTTSTRTASRAGSSPTRTATEALNAAQSGAMGEAWSDWYAKDFLDERGPAGRHGRAGRGRHGRLRRRDPEPDPHPAARLPRRRDRPRVPRNADGGRRRLHLRRLRPRLRPRPGGPLRRRDLGRDAVGPAHRAERLRSSPRQLVTEAMRLSPPEPSFLDERNAIIQADQSLRGGTHVAAIWDVFARARHGLLRRDDRQRRRSAGREHCAAAASRRPDGHDHRPRHGLCHRRAAERDRRRHRRARHAAINVHGGHATRTATTRSAPSRAARTRSSRSARPRATSASRRRLPPPTATRSPRMRRCAATGRRSTAGGAVTATNDTCRRAVGLRPGRRV